MVIFFYQDEDRTKDSTFLKQLPPAFPHKDVKHVKLFLKLVGDKSQILKFQFAEDERSSSRKI